MNESAPSQSIVVVGRGSASVNPDVAVLNVGLEVRSDTPGEALAAVSSRADAVTRAARDQGVEDQDLQTRGLSISPHWDKQSNRLIGYTATYDLVLRIKEIGSSAQVIDTIAAASGDAFRLGGLELVVSSTDAARKEASVRAVEDARNQAQVLAAAAGVRVGRVLSISENEFPSRPFRTPAFLAAAGPAIEVGSREFTVQVNVAFEIND